MKKLLALLLACVMVLGLVACGGETTEETNAPADNTPATEAVSDETEGDTAAASGSVYWLNFKPESDEALKQIAAMYTEETGVPVQIVTAASGTYNETLTAEMDKSTPPTIFVVGNNAAVQTWGDYCYDLTGTPVEQEMNTTQYHLYDADGKLCSIAYCYECYGIIVNKTLLAEAGYDIDYITNYETLKEVVEDIHARSAELGFDAFTSAGMDGSSSWRFTGHLINLDYYWESVDDPDAWVTCPESIKGTYMDNFRQLYDLMVVNCATDRAALANGGFDACAEFGNREAVFYVNGNWDWSNIEAYGITADEVGMIPYYGGVEGEEMVGLNAGTENYWAINSEASEEDIQASLDFLYWMVTDPEASEIAVGTFGYMPYTNAVESPNPFYASANALLAKGCSIMECVNGFQPNVDAYRATAVSAMNQYNADPTDENWALVVAAFVDGWAVQYAAANG